MLRDYQAKALEEIRALYAKGIKRVLLHMATGGGKCLARGTPVVMADGRLRKVEDIEPGDSVMGPDSRPRAVLSTCTGRERLWRVKPVKGEDWVCNESHILSLVHTVKGHTINIAVRDYLSTTKNFKHVHKLWRTGIDMPEAPVRWDPYVVGIWIAEGSVGCAQVTNPDEEILSYLRTWAEKNDLLVRDEDGNNCRQYRFVRPKGKRQWYQNPMKELARACGLDKRVPSEYLHNSRAVRLELLAGLLDGDGHMHHGGFEIVTKFKGLADDILYLARSLGFSAYVKETVKGIKSTGFKGLYWRITISGDLSFVPNKVERKKAPHRRQIKSVLRTGFDLECLGEGAYFGFELSGDGLFLLGDFTVTHNTKCFSEILKAAHAKGSTALVVVRGRKLISQASARLKRDGVPHGVIMAGASQNTFENIRVCSIDTLHRRGETPNADMIVIDEAHQTGGAGYKWFLEQYAGKFILGVTATPHLKRGMRHLADAVVRPITAEQLTEQGYLVPLRYWTPESPDLTGVTTTGDDYNQKELGKAMRKAALSGNIVKTYQDKADGRKAILFAVDIEHSKQLVEQFGAAGIAAGHIDANCTDEERDEAIARLEKKEISVLSNVGVLTTGVDIPPVELIIMARPTKSYNLWIQMIGRGTRPCPENQKTDCYIFDHAGNVAKHGLLEQERECHLDGKPPGQAPQVKQCQACFAWCGNFASVCPSCGEPFQEQKKPERNKETDEAAELKLYALPPWEKELNRLTGIAKAAGYKPGFIYHRIKNMYGDHIAKKSWKVLRAREPQWFVKPRGGGLL